MKRTQRSANRLTWDWQNGGKRPSWWRNYTASKRRKMSKSVAHARSSSLFLTSINHFLYLSLSFFSWYSFIFFFITIFFHFKFKEGCLFSLFSHTPVTWFIHDQSFLRYTLFSFAQHLSYLCEYLLAGGIAEFIF